MNLDNNLFCIISRSVGVEDKEENPGTKNRIFNTNKQFPNR